MYNGLTTTFKDNLKDPLYRQCFILKDISGQPFVPVFYCSLHEDFSDLGITLSDYYCTGDDLRFGESPAATLTCEIINQNALITQEDLGVVTAFIGVETENGAIGPDPTEIAYFTYNHDFEDDRYSIRRADDMDEAGFYINNTLIQAGDFYGLFGDAYVQYSTQEGDLSYIRVYAVSQDGAYLYTKEGTNAGVLEEVPVSAFMAEKLRTQGAFLFTHTAYFDGNAYVNERVDYNSLWINLGEEYIQYDLCPMGTFDISTARITSTNVIALDSVPDNMAKLDRLATDAIASIKALVNPKISDVFDEITTATGLAFDLSGHPYRNRSINPAYLMDIDPNTTYRQLLNWLAEYGLCSIRMARDSGSKAVLVPLRSEIAVQYDIDDISTDGYVVGSYTTGRITGVRITDVHGKVHKIGGDQSNPYSIYCNPLFGDKTVGTQFTKFLSMPIYNPVECTIINAEPWLDPGDVISIPVTRTDGYVYADSTLQAYADGMRQAYREGMQYDDAPLLQRTFIFNGRCHATYMMPGNERRSLTEAMEYASNTDLLTQEDLMQGFEGYTESLMTPFGNSAFTGNIITVDEEAMAVATDTNKSVASVTLPSGTWLIIAWARFASNATGYRQILLSNMPDSGSARAMIARESANAVNGANTEMRCVTFFRLLYENTKLHMNVFQNSGTNVNVTARLYAIQIA